MEGDIWDIHPEREGGCPRIVRRMPWFVLDDPEIESPEVQLIAEAILSHA